uniref:Uncharacterized protein n=1 Tax=Trypanosoma congolense (strain IL3000) TaxID=1068625 RepID=G0UPS0_TRYCI|nr:conserved hypothetical protein [Trypanosoma congolense IL3000]
MPKVRPCGWDHKTLPYIPKEPCLLYYLIPGDPVLHAAVPNARGEYPNLIPGMPYVEESMESEEDTEDTPVVPLIEYAPPPLLVDAGTQVGWDDLPIPPPDHFQRYEKRPATALPPPPRPVEPEQRDAPVFVRDDNRGTSTC